jgi:UDPglucose 6-dehydrogenase
MSKKITVIGTGYIGLISAIGFADFGNNVIAVDINEAIVKKLNKGIPTIYEHGIKDYLLRNLKAGRLEFTTNLQYALQKSEIIFLAVGTPSKNDGGADLSAVYNVVNEIAKYINDFKVIVTKSTVPVGTNREIYTILQNRTNNKDFAVVSNPEFLREGRAVQDFFHPDRIVIGYEDERAKESIIDIYRPLYLIETPFIWCTLETAELIKYASNAFLATKISFINQLANLCEACNADIHQIAKAMGMDGRISPKFFHPGPGYGGSCFPKDTKALVSTGKKYKIHMSLVNEVINVNEEQKKLVVVRLRKLLGNLNGKKIAVLGLAFKAETDDVRESPAIEIVRALLQEGASIQAHDPKATDNFKKILNDGISFYDNEFEALQDTDCMLILTEWNEYRNLDLPRAKKLMKNPLILDTRNVLSPSNAKELGFHYTAIGRDHSK